MGDKILVKQIANATTMQMVGAGKNRPSFLDYARNTFGQRGQGITRGQRARGLVGMAGKTAAGFATALNTADSMQQGNVSAPLQAGISYQGLDPTATLDQNVGSKLNQNAQFQNPTPTYDYTHTYYPVNQFVQNTGVAVQQPQQPQQSAGYGPVNPSPTLGQTVQAPPAQAQAPPAQAQAQAQPAQQPPVDNSHLPPVAISTQPPVPMGGAQADVMRTPATATPTDGTLNTEAMLGSGGFVPTQAATMDERSNQLQGLAPVQVRQPIQQQPIQQQPIQQQTDNIDPEMRAYLESIRGEDVKPLGVQNVAGGGQGFQNLDFSGAGQAYNQGIGVNNSPFKRKVKLPDGREIEVSSDQLIRSEFTDMLFDILGPDNLYKMTPNEIGELAAFMYIKTR